MIQMKNVSFRYEETQSSSLKDVSIVIPDGQCVLLCGESGCGKTTLTRLINGLIPHYYEGELQGTVTVNGLDIAKAELYETAKIVGSVFQNPRSQFFCVDTTSEIAFGCENMGMPEDEIHTRINQAVSELNIEPLLDRDIFQLSGGEKQKIACASVSALTPDVFVLDEPTSNLDINAIDELKQTILLWKAKGKTVVIAEHRLHWLMDVCDRVIYLKNGEISADLPVEQFRTYSSAQIAQMGLRTLEMNVPACKVVADSKDTIELREFNFSYDTEPMIHIPVLTLPKDGIIAVVGNNGAGKSTFTHCLCGQEKKFKGYAVIDGKSLHRKELLRESYMVMQDVNHQLFCESVEEEVRLGMKKENECRVMKVLEQMDLTDFLERHPMSLSGGQKQRVAIASAILSNKSLLVFDEPTSGLDRRHMEQTGALISELKGQKTVLIVTHDLELIAQCCTHVLYIECGMVKECCSLEGAGFQKVLAYFGVETEFSTIHKEGVK